MSWKKVANIEASTYRSNGEAHEPYLSGLACLQPYWDHEGRETEMNRRSVLPTPFTFYETLLVGEHDIVKGDIFEVPGIKFVVRRAERVGPTPNIERFMRLGMEESLVQQGDVIRKSVVSDGMGGRTESWPLVYDGKIVVHPTYVGADMILTIDQNRREAQKAPYRVELPADVTVVQYDRIRCLGVGILLEVIGVHVGTNGTKWAIGVEL